MSRERTTQSGDPLSQAPLQIIQILNKSNLYFWFVNFPNGCTVWHVNIKAGQIDIYMFFQSLTKQILQNFLPKLKPKKPYSAKIGILHTKYTFIVISSLWTINRSHLYTLWVAHEKWFLKWCVQLDCIVKRNSIITSAPWYTCSMIIIYDLLGSEGCILDEKNTLCNFYNVFILAEHFPNLPLQR